jgi:hypothetical protein
MLSPSVPQPAPPPPWSPDSIASRRSRDRRPTPRCAASKHRGFRGGGALPHAVREEAGEAQEWRRVDLCEEAGEAREWRHVDLREGVGGVGWWSRQ